MFPRYACVILTAIPIVCGELGEFSFDNFDRVIVIPDVHGDLEYLMASIVLGAQNSNYPDLTLESFEDLLVNGGIAPEPLGLPERTALVQLGDVTNRGPGSKQCFTVLSAIESIFGWHVIRLLGNHELMAFTGKDERYVHESEYDFFGGPQYRAREFSIEGSLWSNIASTSLIMARFSGNSATASNTLFVHGGVGMDWISALGLATSVGVLNTLGQSAMKFPYLADRILGDIGSPLWTRDFDTESGDFDWCRSTLSSILTAFNVSRIVVGHSPLDEKRVQTRCDQRLVLTDVKLSRWMNDGGQPIAVIISEDGTVVEAHYGETEDMGEEFSETVIAPPVREFRVLRSRSVDSAAAVATSAPSRAAAKAVSFLTCPPRYPHLRRSVSCPVTSQETYDSGKF
jgi:hypothetical protein